MIDCALFIGLGGVGQRHLRNLRAVASPGLRTLAYRVRRETRLLSDQLTEVPGGNLESEYGLEVFDELEAALAQKPQLAIVANPTSLHIEVAQKVVNAGVDLFVEKPLSHNRAGVQKLIDSAEAAGTVSLVTYQLRFHPAVQKLNQLLRERKLGKIFGARVEVAEYLPGFHPYEDYRRMYASRADLGGGVTLTQIHEIDLIYQLFGMPQSVWSVADRLSDLEIDVEDSATSLLRYQTAEGASFAVSLHQDYLGSPPRRSFQIWGEKGLLRMDLRAGTLSYVPSSGSPELVLDASEHPRNQLFVDELLHFLDCVETRKQTSISLREGAQSLWLALALRESQASGKLVELPQSNREAA